MAATKALTDDILMEILSRLPVETLLRFKSVSKNWNSLIQSPDFVNLHRIRKRKESLFVLRTIRLSVCPIGNGWFKTVMTPLEAETLTPVTEMNFFEMPTIASIKGDVYRSMDIFGPCKGIVCIKDEFFHVFCNPATREFKSIPYPPFSYPENTDIWNGLSGFGYNAIADDYKVLRVVRPGRCDERIYNYYRPYKVEMYSLRDDTWTESNVKFPYTLSFRAICNMTFADSCHWIGFEWSTGLLDKDQYMFILVFDVVEDVFRTIELPEEEGLLEGLDCGHQLMLITYDDSLSLIKYELHTTICSFHLWVMREYGVPDSWYKFSIGPLDGVHRPLASRNVDELFLETGDGELVICDPRTEEIKETVVIGQQYTFTVAVFPESLTSIKGYLPTNDFIF